MRYPAYEINKLMPCINEEIKDINEIMFNENPYFKEVFGKFNMLKELEWDKFFNKDAFINSLNEEEQKLLSKPKYNSLYENDLLDLDLTLTSEGEIIYVTAPIIYFIKSKNRSFEETSGKILKGKHIKEAIKYFKENHKDIKITGLEHAVELYEREKKFKESLLDCVMYRIIERGGNRIGPRRGLLFAKEFNRSVDIPMMYGVDRSDPGLKLFIQEYLKLGGKTDLVCLNGYWIKKIDFISVYELMDKKCDMTSNSKKIKILK